MTARRIPLSLLTLFLLGITSVFAGLPEINPEEAKRCRLVGNVEATSGYGKNARWQPIAKANAGRKAEALGATHLEITSMKDIGTMNGVINANAYVCP
jgi:hypothetical protein